MCCILVNQNTTLCSAAATVLESRSWFVYVCLCASGLCYVRASSNILGLIMGRLKIFLKRSEGFGRCKGIVHPKIKSLCET